jgi:MFS superfamily sulfate permease-like transporter
MEPATAVFAAAVLGLLFVGQWRFRRLPTPLIVVSLATAAVVAPGSNRTWGPRWMPTG